MELCDKHAVLQRSRVQSDSPQWYESSRGANWIRQLTQLTGTITWKMVERGFTPSLQALYSFLPNWTSLSSQSRCFCCAPKCLVLLAWSNVTDYVFLWLCLSTLSRMTFSRALFTAVMTLYIILQRSLTCNCFRECRVLVVAWGNKFKWNS